MKKIIFSIFTLALNNAYCSISHAQTAYSIQGQKGPIGVPGINGSDPGPPANGQNGTNGICSASACFQNILPYANAKIRINQSAITVSDQTRSLNTTNSTFFIACQVSSNNIIECANIESDFNNYMNRLFEQPNLTNTLVFITKGQHVSFFNNSKNSSQTWFEFLIQTYGLSDEILNPTPNNSLILLVIHPSKNSFSHVFHEESSNFDILGVLFSEKSSLGILHTKAERSTRYLNDIERPASVCSNRNVMVLGPSFWKCDTGNTIKQAHISSYSLSNNLIATNTISLVDFQQNGLKQSISFQNSTLQTADISSNTLTNNVFNGFSVQTSHFANFNLTTQDLASKSIHSNHIMPANVINSHIDNVQILSSHIQNGSIIGTTIGNISISSNILTNNTIKEIHIKTNSLVGNNIIEKNISLQTHIETNSLTINKNNTNGVVRFSYPGTSASITIADKVYLPNTVLNTLFLPVNALITCTGCVGSEHIASNSISYDNLDESAKIPTDFCVFTVETTCPQGLQPDNTHLNMLLKTMTTDIGNTVTPTFDITHSAHKHIWSTAMANRRIGLYTVNGILVEGINYAYEENTGASGGDDTMSESSAADTHFYSTNAVMGNHTVTTTGRLPDKAFGLKICCKK